jgi:Fur family transcriptional regulator, ferric uptake regulator
VSTEDSRAKFRTHLAAHGLRITNQRLAIFDAAFSRKEHFTAEELLTHSRAIDDSVSRATVYRTLPHLIGSGVLREVDIGKNLKYYLPNTDNSAQVAQVICVDCDKIFEISAPFMTWYGSTVSSKLGLTPISQRLQVNAHCDSLKSVGVCKHRAAPAAPAAT